MGWSTSRQTGLVCSNEKSFGGYSVIVPNGGDHVYLLGPDGMVKHNWCLSWFKPGYAFLTKSGTLLTRGRLMVETKIGWQFTEGADILLELDWDGNVLWRWQDGDLHHGMQRLPNGNTLIIIWTPLPSGFHQRIKGGMPKDKWKALLDADPTFLDFALEGMGVGGRPKMEGEYGDAVVEVTPEGKIVKQWNTFDHLSPEENPTCAFCPGAEWTHANSIDLTASAEVILSFREISKTIIIDWETDEIVWEFGAPVISHQHDPNETPDGNILIFDNGAHHPIQGRSRVIEVDRKTKKIVWQWSGDPVFSFRCLHIGGAEKLANGNYMVCEGECGRMIEVTPEKEICWEWVSPFEHDFKGKPNIQIFKARTYAADSKELEGRDLSGESCKEINLRYKLHACK